MADWIIPCNPEYYDIFSAFEKLNSVDWRQSTKSIVSGDNVYIYVGKPVQAIAYRCRVMEAMIPSSRADFSDAEFEKGDSLEPYAQYMRLKPERKIPLNALTFDIMRKAGLRGNIQGPRLLPDELKSLFDVFSHNKSEYGEIHELMQEIEAFSEERDWDQFHTPVNLAKSISIEAGELLECFQWNDAGEPDNVEEELADVLTYCLQLATKMNMDPAEIIRKKLRVNAVKYPVEKSKGRSTKYDKL